MREMFNIPIPAGDAASIINTLIGHPGLYLHIPFCESICPFCPYNKVIYDKDLATSYFNALEQELDRYIDSIKLPFASLYIGGGTPTLCLDALGRITKRLAVTGERAIEVLPNHATVDNVIRMKDIGVNYISLGIQSFDDSVLRYLKRPNTAVQNHNALKATQGQFDCVDVDLIFDVAFADESIFLRDLEICFQAGVDQVSTYPLMRFGYTPFGKARHQPRSEHRLLRKAAAIARQHGYERRSVWTFNRIDAPNYTSITREFYIGCGAGAASYTGSLFCLNHFSIPAYIDKVNGGYLPIARMTELPQLRSAVYYLFWQAYTGKVSIPRFDNLFPGQHLLKCLLRTLHWTGLFRAKGKDLLLTDSGYDHYHDLERWVTYHFIEPLWSDMMHEHAHLADHLAPLNRFQRFWLRMAGVSQA